MYIYPQNCPPRYDIIIMQTRFYIQNGGIYYEKILTVITSALLCVTMLTLAPTQAVASAGTQTTFVQRENALLIVTKFYNRHSNIEQI